MAGAVVSIDGPRMRHRRGRTYELAAGGADERQPGGYVPDSYVAFEVRVCPARGNIRQRERCGSKHPYFPKLPDLPHETRQGGGCEIGTDREARTEYRSIRRRRSHVHRAPIQPRAVSDERRKQLITIEVIHCRGQWIVISPESHRHATERYALDVVHRAVKGVNDPAEPGGGRCCSIGNPFFGNNRNRRPPCQDADDPVLSGTVRLEPDIAPGLGNAWRVPAWAAPQKPPRLPRRPLRERQQRDGLDGWGRSVVISHST